MNDHIMSENKSKKKENELRISLKTVRVSLYMIIQGTVRRVGLI